VVDVEDVAALAETKFAHRALRSRPGLRGLGAELAAEFAPADPPLADAQ
jgi:hypothetical protein